MQNLQSLIPYALRRGSSSVNSLLLLCVLCVFAVRSNYDKNILTFLTVKINYANFLSWFCQSINIYPPISLKDNMPMTEFTHLDEKNKSRMVDVTAKEPTFREAVAEGKVLMRPDIVRAIEEGGVSKGDVFGVAKIAGIMAAKRTSDIIPMCHPLELTGIDIHFSSHSESGEITIQSKVKTFGRTGVEMEALTAVSTAALTIYDMCKSADKEIILSDIKLLKKSGGKSGTFSRKE